MTDMKTSDNGVVQHFVDAKYPGFDKELPEVKAAALVLANKLNSAYFIIAVIDQEGEIKYVTRGDYSDFGIHGSRISDAKPFETQEQALEVIRNHPEFNRRNVYLDNSSAPPSIIWSGLGICNERPQARGVIVIQRVSVNTEWSETIQDKLIGRN